MTDWQARHLQIVQDSDAHLGVATPPHRIGQEVMIDADTPVPLASVVKVPVLVEAFRQLGEGRFSLDGPLAAGARRYKALGSGILTLVWTTGWRRPSRDLITLMIIISDNTATDILMERLGLERNQRHMHRLGLVQYPRRAHAARDLRGHAAQPGPGSGPLRPGPLGSTSTASGAMVSATAWARTTTSARRAT